eukprot:bmy_08578T0
MLDALQLQAEPLSLTFSPIRHRSETKELFQASPGSISEAGLCAPPGSALNLGHGAQCASLVPGEREKMGFCSQEAGIWAISVSKIAVRVRATEVEMAGKRKLFFRVVQSKCNVTQDAESVSKLCSKPYLLFVKLVPQGPATDKKKTRHSTLQQGRQFMRRQELSSGLSWMPMLTWTVQPQGAPESHTWTLQDAELKAISHSDDGEVVPPWQAGPCEQTKLTGMRIKSLMLRNVPEMQGKVDETVSPQPGSCGALSETITVVQLTSREQTEPSSPIFPCLLAVVLRTVALLEHLAFISSSSQPCKCSLQNGQLATLALVDNSLMALQVLTVNLLIVVNITFFLMASHQQIPSQPPRKGFSRQLLSLYCSEGTHFSELPAPPGIMPKSACGPGRWGSQPLPTAHVRTFINLGVISGSETDGVKSQFLISHIKVWELNGKSFSADKTPEKGWEKELLFRFHSCVLKARGCETARDRRGLGFKAAR